MGWKVWVVIIWSTIMSVSSWQVIIPEATTNLCTNPSAELGTTGWAVAGAGNAIAQDTTESWRGIYSFKSTWGSAGTHGAFGITLPTATTTYVASCYTWVPSNWDGGDIRINIANFTGSSETFNAIWTAGTDDFEKWHYLETVFTVAADVAGNVSYNNGISAPTAARFTYFDGFQIEEKSTATTYCDGDQEGCSWQASPHASASDRSALSFAGGQLQDLDDDLSLAVQQATGMGTARGKNNITNFAITPGGDFQQRKIQTRRSGPRGVIKGCSLADLHAKRAELNNALIDDLGEPVRIRYTGATTPKTLKWYYERGLDYTRHDNFNEKITLRGDSTEPFWQAEEETSALLDSQDSTAFRYVAGRLKNTGAWGNLGVATNGDTVRSIVRAPDGTLYVGGSFSQINAVANTGGIAQYDPVAGTWTAVGTGVTGGSDRVNALAFDSAGNLYAGGSFTQMGGIAFTSRIAMWDGAAWNALGTGANDVVNALQPGLTGLIVAGGDFTSMSGVADTIAVAWWDGSAWNDASGGAAAGVINALALGPSGSIYAGGTFTTIGGTSANRIAYWTGSAWVAMGPGMDNNTVESLAVSSSGVVYAGGTFTLIDGDSVSQIAQWNGVSWSAMGDGSAAGSTVFVIFVAPDGLVYAGGDFTSTTNKFARWNGSLWVDADINLLGTVYSILADKQDAVAASNYDLHVGFSTAATYTHSGTVTVTNPGTTLFLPIVEIARTGGTTATIISIRNETIGRELFLNYGLLDGETLSIDTKTQAVTSNFWGSRLDAILRSSDFATFALRRGDNVISVFVATSGGPTITAALRGHAQFAGFDG